MSGKDSDEEKCKVMKQKQKTTSLTNVERDVFFESFNPIATLSNERPLTLEDIPTISKNLLCYNCYTELENRLTATEAASSRAKGRGTVSTSSVLGAVAGRDDDEYHNFDNFDFEHATVGQPCSVQR